MKTSQMISCNIPLDYISNQATPNDNIPDDCNPDDIDPDENIPVDNISDECNEDYKISENYIQNETTLDDHLGFRIYDVTKVLTLFD